jgi:hypothetical protein
MIVEEPEPVYVFAYECVAKIARIPETESNH